MLDWYEKYQKEVLFTSDLNQFIIVDDLDRLIKNLVILDDCVTETDQKIIIDLYIRDRKKNSSIIYITQIFYSVRRIIRLNSIYFIIYNAKFDEVYRIIRELDGKSKEELLLIYNKVFQNEHDI